MKTKITELLNIDYPIFQGGMAWVADGDLAGAVSNAGGMGIIGGGGSSGVLALAVADQVSQLVQLQALPLDQLLENRYQCFRKY
ncbi:TPA: nitronate monooxygenase [Streptococcus suis]